MEPQTPVTITPSPTTPTQAAPEAWPGAFGLVKYSKKAALFNLWPLLGLAALYIVMSIAFAPLNGHKQNTFSFGPGDTLVSLVGVLLVTAGTFVLLAGVRRTKMSLTEALGLSLPLFVKAWALNIFTSLIALVSLVLFVFPFFIIMPRLGLALFFLVDKKMGPVESIKASWAATKGNVGKVWGIYGVTFLMAIAVIVLIGFYFLFIYSAALTLLYVFLTNQQDVSTVPAPQEPAVVPPATTL